MKIILFSRAQIAHTPEEIRQLIGTIGAFGFDYAVNEEFAPLVEQATGTALPPERIYGRYIGKQPAETVMVCYGGDGTLLEGVHRLCGAPIPVMGINAGHLGFLTSAPSNGLNLIFREIAEGNIATEPRSMLRVTGEFARQPESQLALNEFTVQRHGAGMISVETYVDRQMVATYHAQRGRPAGGRLRHAGQPDLPRFARRVVHRGAGRTDDFFGRAAQYIILRHVTE